MTDAPAEKKKNRVYLTRAYVKLLEANLYGLFRDTVMEEIDEKTAEVVKEKVGTIGPFRLLREMKKGEEQRVVLKTVHPTTAQEIALVELEGQDAIPSR